MKNKQPKLLAATIAVGALFIASESFAFEYFPGPQGNGGPRGGGGYSSVPELDASGAPIALALVGGIAGIALERRRRKKK